ncbi:hypothetical protein DL95DRAFT_409495 [Leptodontidium sp. 2 PMI_412]|nr:hypothetical protein DL95DRAFT_409495 [Leptodontidium sp. 2 PMI_412]
MTACQAGDLKLVQSPLNQGKASVNDITTSNFSPLSRFSGHCNVSSRQRSRPKADIWPFSNRPLEWAFAHRKLHAACWLLNNKADVHHISARGWTAAFGLFGDALMYKALCDEFLDSLASASFVDFDAQDRDG